ncbi:MAG: HAD-IC family P-type ATPase, partial [Tatlockia sp.]
SDVCSSDLVNWINIALNCLTVAMVIGLTFIFPPSLPLTVGLTALTFFTTTLTARAHLLHFFHNLAEKNLFTMTSTISLGWFLSLAHTVYHTLMMPLISGFTMVFSSFLMPLTFMTFINSMDELKRVIQNKSKKMQIQGMKNLLPQLAEEYPCALLSQEEQVLFSKYFADPANAKSNQPLPPYSTQTVGPQKKNRLQEGMLIHIESGGCFPVDCRVIEGNTFVDATLETGQKENKNPLDFIPGGALNLGKAVWVYALKDVYHSTANRLAFRANRARKPPPPQTSSNRFVTLYAGLFALIMATSILAPLAFGVLTVPLFMATSIGILCVFCPCVVAIAYQLPQLWSTFQRHRKGIILRDEQLTEQADKIKILVLDKTGTLTTGEEVAYEEGISPSCWERIYLLENQSAGHPIKEAILRYYEKEKKPASPLFTDITSLHFDHPKYRGLSARVQGIQMDIGNASYLKDRGIALPPLHPKSEEGLTTTYVAQGGVFVGRIFIKQEVREGMHAQLLKLKSKKIRPILLTGDSCSSAQGFMRQYSGIFDSKDVHAEQTPEAKQLFLKTLMDKKKINPNSVWFVGDGFNDALCARIVSEKGGVSCSITPADKAAFYTDISLNGTLDYVFKHNTMNRFIQKTAFQNKGLLVFSTLAFLAFILTFSSVGLAVAPIIPVLIMFSTIAMVLFNSYRNQLKVDNSLDTHVSWSKRFLKSDASLALILSATILFIASIILSTLVTGGFAMPALVFGAGALSVVSSLCLLGSVVTTGLFMVCAALHAVMEKFASLGKTKETMPLLKQTQPKPTEPKEMEESHYSTLYSEKAPLPERPFGQSSLAYK